jgi:hypothetical protein
MSKAFVIINLLVPFILTIAVLWYRAERAERQEGARLNPPGEQK